MMFFAFVGAVEKLEFTITVTMLIDSVGPQGPMQQEADF